MATQWYYKNGTDERGPVQYRELIELARAGSIGRDDFVRSTYHKEWQRAEGVLKEYFPVEGSQPGSPWAETVEAAVEAVRHRAGGRGSKIVDRGSQEEERGGWIKEGGSRLVRGVGGLVGWMVWPIGWLVGRFGWLERLVVWGDDAWGTLAGSAGLKRAVQIVCGLACAGFAALVLRDWSAQEALHNLASLRGKPLPEGVWYFPFVGGCAPGEYWFMYAEVLAVAAAAGYFVAGWFLEESE